MDSFVNDFIWNMRLDFLLHKPISLIGGLLDEGPPPPTNEKCAEAALDWVNVMRGEYGLESLEALPRGTQGDVGDCVLARAMGGLSDKSCPLPASERYGNAKSLAAFAREGQMVEIELPPLVAEFIRRFDRGRYPDLVAEPVLPSVMPIIVKKPPVTPPERPGRPARAQPSAEDQRCAGSVREKVPEPC